MNEKPTGIASFLLPLLFLALTLMVRPSLPAATPADTGSITGQVSNAATGSFLEGAVVAVEGTTRLAVTDREGRFLLSGLAPGAATLIVSFSGLDTQRIPITLSRESRTVRDVSLTSEIYLMEKVTVAGEREGTAKSEVLRRQAPNVMNAISADTFGNRADANIANLLENIEGISAIYNDNEARQVSIRGIDGNLNSVMMNGQQLASSAGGTGRNFLFDQQGLGHVESIEVYKAATPDMAGASVGGGINLITKSAFDRTGGRQFTYSAGFSTQPTFLKYAPKWKEPVPGMSPFFNFSYMDVLGEKKNLGIAVTTSLTNYQIGHVRPVLTHLTRDAGPTAVTGFSRRPWTVNRTKFLSGVTLNYRWSEHTTVSLGLTYGYSHLLANNPQANLSAAATLATVDASGNRTGGGFVSPSFSYTGTEIFPGASSTNTLISTVNNEFGQTVTLQPTVRHRLDGWDIDYGMSYSDDMTRKDRGSREHGSVTMAMANIGWRLDFSGDPVAAKVIQTAGPDMYNLNNFTSVQFNQNARGNSSEVIVGNANLKKQLTLARPAFLKTGVAYQRETRRLETDTHRYTYAGRDGVLGNADDRLDLGQFTETGSKPYSHSDYVKYFQDSGGLVRFPDAYGVARHKLTNPAMWVEDEAFGVQTTLLSRRQITEQISAAYAMGHMRFERASVLAGVRVEETRASGEGPLNYISPAERARRAAWVGTVTPAESLRRAIAQYGGRRSNEGKYNNVLPSIHFRYEPLERVITRASWSTGIGRPAFGNIIPSDTVDDTNLRVTANNPNLKAQYVHSYDLIAEYYFPSQGMISAGVFQKDISDFIFSNTSVIGPGADNGFGGEYTGYTLTTQSNRGSAKVQGMEFSYRQQLTFLPGWARGFSVNATYTKLKTEGNYGGNVALSTSSLQGFVPQTGAFGLTYRGYNMELRLQAVFYDEYLAAANTDPRLQQWWRSRSTWNWKSKYNFSRKLSVFLDIDNVTGAHGSELYRGYRDRPNQFGTFEPKIQVGVSGQF
jgi:TonB-dependent receptor